jgi:hypothetical protein
MKWLRDTATGLWPVIKTYVPKPGLVIAVVVAFLIGLIWAYALDPVVYYDGDPWTLGQSWQDEWVRLAAERYDYAASRSVLTDEFRAGVVDTLSRVDNPVEIVNRLGLVQLSDLAAQAQQRADLRLPPPQPNILESIRPFLVGPVVLTVALVLGSLLTGFYVIPLVIDPIRKRIRGSQGISVEGKAAVDNIKQAREMAKQLDKEAATSPGSSLGPPVVRHVSIYMPGRAYDDSFSIEDAQKDDEFLGECGATISETIGAGQPEKVTAVEVWLFDKEDFVRTLTGVFVSEHAYNDPAIRSKLAPKGELIVAKPGAVLKLTTNSLDLQARIVDVGYGTGPLPPNSYFDKLTIELQAWRKAPSAAPVAFAVPAIQPAPTMRPPQPQPAFSQPPQPTFTPPPQPTYTPPQPAPSPFNQPAKPMAAPPSVGGFGNPPPATPLRPQPLSPPPRRPDDDPFGGTGDFTPVN